MAKRNQLRVSVFSAKERPLDELAWCALCQDVKPLSWKDGKLLCFEMKFYLRSSRLVVLDSCVASMPAYSKTLRVEGTANIPSATITVVKASAVAEKVLEKTLDQLNK